MKKLLSISLIFLNFLFAFSITKVDLEYIKSKPNYKQTIKRLLNYKKFLKKTMKYKEITKVHRTNRFLNNILSQKDQIVGVNDYWETRKEFLIYGRGDCEDYAIAKYFTLKELKVDPKKLYLCVVKVKNSKTMHMILLYFKDKYSIPLVLDNLSFKVLPLNKRKDLMPKFCFNEYEYRRIKNNFLAEKIRVRWGKLDKWKDVLYREKKGIINFSR